jgi:hypothetical protein
MRFRPSLLTVRLLITATALLVSAPGALCQNIGFETAPTAEFATDDIQQPIRVRADFEEVLPLNGDAARVHLLMGRVRLEQGGLAMQAGRMAIVAAPLDGSFDVRIYGEDVEMRDHDSQQILATRVVRLQSLQAPEIVTGSSRTVAASQDPLFARAAEQLFPDQFQRPPHVALQVTPDAFLPPISAGPGFLSSNATRRIQVRPRSSQPLAFDSSISSDTVPEEQVWVITGGVNILIEGVEVDLQGQPVSPGVIDISADRIVAWTQATGGGALDSGDVLVQSADTRFQVYLEGNIVIRHKQNTITATHAFFDANNDRALMMNAELRALVPTTGGYVRVRAERMRQLSRDRFHAQNAWATTSPYGHPGYRIQATDIFVEPGSGSPWTSVDPMTGQQIVNESTWITSLNNQLIIGDTPVLWLPKISAPADDPGIPIRRVTMTQDRIFGFQVKTVWDMTKILGMPRQPGLEWNLLGNYMTERGPGVGTSARYSGTSPLGNYLGNGTLYYQYDSGTDNLGLDRRDLQPQYENRGEATWRHRQRLPGGGTVFGEIGYITDRNYLEQYDESRFDTDKDVETLLGIRQDWDAWSGLLWTKPELNKFEASTEWLPRADLYSFSQPLGDDLAYWSSHSSVAYGHINPMQAPSDPNDPFTPLGLPYMSNVSGLVTMTRHEVDAPFTLGPVNFDPYVMGEAAYWDEGLAGNSIDRYLLSAGIRARLFAWKVMPFVNSPIFNLRGLAHKHETMLEYAWTDSSRGINEIAQYNEIDENSQERFRTRYTTQIFPGVIPAEFNPQNYAIRTGAGLWATVPYHELADDQQVLRLSFRNRLQTKSGPAHAERTRDWMIWESGVSWFPDADRDNFGEDFGLFYARYRWNISDRTSLLADDMVDFFENAQNIWSLGILSQRSTRGSVYLGYREVGLGSYLESQILTGSYSYQMSPKWISTAAGAYDVAEKEARGASLTVSRVGLDWILHMGLGFDFSKDNVGVGFSVEPRFGPPSPTNLGYLLGLQ